MLIFAQFSDQPECFDSRSGDNARKPLSEAIAVISACWKYHMPIAIQESMTFLLSMNTFLQLFSPIALNFQKFPKYKNEACKKVFLGTRITSGQ